jgi:regulatory subunit for Cdc7p protein kinase
MDHGPGFDVLSKAVSYNKKIWSITKLESVLMRLIDPRSASAPAVSKTNTISCPSMPVNSQRVLTRLLQSERVHGTLERDPSQKRHDFRYFSRASRFVLVEDMRQELATISAHEYPVAKGREGTAKPPWPILHCHPCARGPFIAYDEREKKRWEKTQKVEADQRQERKERSNSIKPAESVNRRTEKNMLSRKTGDLRRSASMNNLRRRATLPAACTHEDGLIDLDKDGDFCASTNPSGFLASGVGGGYMAASGNSVGITSTTGTTSNAGYALRTVKLPAASSGRIKQEVVTSRKFPVAAAGKEDRVALMAPPTVVPEKQLMLKKSRSTNTLKLPKREEGSKPGYCESCRVKFDDFNDVCIVHLPLPHAYNMLVARYRTQAQEVCSRRRQLLAAGLYSRPCTTTDKAGDPWTTPENGRKTTILLRQITK